MSAEQKPRKYPRFSTDVKVSFKTSYEFRTEIDFKLNGPRERDSHTYLGFSRNISLDGLCFESPKLLASGDKLWIELHLPGGKAPVYMEGDVRWCKLAEVGPNVPRQYHSGVQITKIDGKIVSETVYFDEEYQVYWSQVLERILGGFAQLHRVKGKG